MIVLLQDLDTPEQPSLVETLAAALGDGTEALAAGKQGVSGAADDDILYSRVRERRDAGRTALVVVRQFADAANLQGLRVALSNLDDVIYSLHACPRAVATAPR